MKPDPVQLLVAMIREGGEPTADVLRDVLQLLEVWLSRRRLMVHDLEDVCSEALGRLVKAVREGELDPARPPGAWLRVVADHLALDVFRRESVRAGTPFDEQTHAPRREDDRLAALLERECSRAEVDRAMQEAAAQGKSRVVDVVSTWRGLERMNHEPPGTRDVAERLGVSHTTVVRALASFGALLGDAGAFQGPAPERKRAGQELSMPGQERGMSEREPVTPIRRYS